MLQALADFQEGKTPESARLDAAAFSAIRTEAAILPDGVQWRTHFAKGASEPDAFAPTVVPALG